MADAAKKYEVLIDGFSGALGGNVAQLVFYPLENLIMTNSKTITLFLHLYMGHQLWLYLKF